MGIERASLCPSFTQRRGIERASLCPAFSQRTRIERASLCLTSGYIPGCITVVYSPGCPMVYITVVYSPGCPMVYNRWCIPRVYHRVVYTRRCITGCTIRWVYQGVYLPICLLGTMVGIHPLPYVHPVPPWVYHRTSSTPSMSALATSLPDDEALGSTRRKPLGESLSCTSES